MENYQAAVMRALEVSHSPHSPASDRAAALQQLESYKQGDTAMCVSLGMALLQRSEQEVQLYGFSLLQAVVRARWAQVSPEQQVVLSNLAVDIAKVVGRRGQASRALTSKAATFVVDVLRNQGTDHLGAVLETFTQFAAEGASQAVTTCTLLRCVSEEVTAGSFVGDLRARMLSVLSGFTPGIVAMLVRVLEVHYAAVMPGGSAPGSPGVAGPALAVTTALGTLAVYAEWMPLFVLLEHPVLAACSTFLQTIEFRGAAAEVLAQVAVRRRPHTTPTPQETAQYAALMSQVASVLLLTASNLLHGAPRDDLGFGGAHEAFGLQLCQVVVAFCGQQFPSNVDDAARAQFYEHMLSFAAHPHLPLSNATLSFWAQVTRQQTAPKAARASMDGRVGEPVENTAAIPAPIAERLLAVLWERLPDVAKARMDAPDFEEPPAFDDLEDFRDFSHSYRSGLKAILRQCAVAHPAPTAVLTSAQVSALRAASEAAGSGPSPPASHVAFECITMLCEAVVGSLCTQPGAHPTAAAILQTVLSLEWGEPHMLSLQAKALEATGHYLSVDASLALPLVTRVMELMQRLPLGCDGRLPPPAAPTPAWRAAMIARLKMSHVPSAVAKAAPAAFGPHLQSIVQQVTALSDTGALFLGEKNNLLESVMYASAAGGAPLLSQAIDWVLSPTLSTWASEGWQASTSTAQAFISSYMQLTQAQDGSVCVGCGEARWALYHQLHIVLSACRACSQLPAPPPAAEHPLTKHLSAVMLSVLRVLACLDGCWAPAVRSSPALAPVSAALDLSPVEVALYMRTSLQAAAATPEESTNTTVAGSNIAALRGFLRISREVGYQTLAQVASTVPSLWGCASVAAALPSLMLSDVPSMDNRNVKLCVRHAILPLLESCPQQAQPQWAHPVLERLVPPMTARLTAAWQAIDTPAGSSTESAAAASEEIVAERVLRDTTRDMLQLLERLTVVVPNPRPRRTASSPDPEVQEPGPARPAGDAPAPEQLLSGLASASAPSSVAVVRLAVSALTWPDAESVRLTVPVCRAIVRLSHAVGGLAEVVAGEMLQAVCVCLSRDLASAAQSEVLGLARDILAAHLRAQPAASQVLLNLPQISPAGLEEFKARFFGLTSERDQRTQAKLLLLGAGGGASAAPLSAAAQDPGVAQVKRHERAGAVARSMMPDAASEDFQAFGVAAMFPS